MIYSVIICNDRIKEIMTPLLSFSPFLSPLIHYLYIFLARRSSCLLPLAGRTIDLSSSSTYLIRSLDNASRRALDREILSKVIVWIVCT